MVVFPIPKSLETFLNKLLGQGVDAATVDSTSNNNAVQGEETVVRGNNTYEHEENVARGNIYVKTISFLIVCLITILVIAYIILATGHPRLKKLHSKYIDVSFTIINETTVSLEGIVTLPTSFVEQRYIFVQPEIGTYSLTTPLIKHYPVSTFTTSPFHIQNEEAVVLKFDAYQTHMPSDEVRVFYRKLHHPSKIWLTLEGNFKVRLSLNNYLVFPYIYRHLDFTCNIRYKAFPRGEIIFERRCAF